MGREEHDEVLVLPFGRVRSVKRATYGRVKADEMTRNSALDGAVHFVTARRTPDRFKVGAPTFEKRFHSSVGRVSFNVEKAGDVGSGYGQILPSRTKADKCDASDQPHCRGVRRPRLR